MEIGYYTCPNCGNKMTDTSESVCNNCTYDFGQLIKCTLLDKDKFCTVWDKPCKINGTDFEECETYLKYGL